MQFAIAVVQCSIAQFAPEENLRKAEHFLQEAARAGANIIVFPEDFVTGPISAHMDFVDFTGRYLAHFQQLAQRYQLDIVPGSIIEGDERGWYNTTYYIDKSGQCRGRYRKANLWHPERSYLSPGNEFPVFQTAYGRVGLLICWDLAFPEVFRKMVQQGVDMVICPSYWCFEDAGIGQKYEAQSEVILVDALCVARAFEHEIVLVYANAADTDDVGLATTEHLIGRSQIAVPFRGVLQRLEHNREAMFLQKIDSALLSDAESVYQIRADLVLRPDLFS
ncbi:MAG TPA: carbon-nitrogen hydrolase family protein [Ktedonobacteraceae bacterium]|jgi:predicted amidohydrolase|nr:carbon-nitrogen hydrolase family protein [Ktedonobacteraceae bacterium]